MSKLATPSTQMTNVHIPHKNIACHIDWDFREEALLRIRDQPTLPNFYPLSDPLDAETRSIRLQTDTFLYPARLCEVLIKQLLHLTTFPENYYRRAALGALLSKDCAGCRSSNNTPHQVSLLGSLAHRYRLCFDFEDCLKEHMKLVKHRRDVEAAHAGIMKLTGESLVAVRKNFEKAFTKHTRIFIHMLEHMSEIEDKCFGSYAKNFRQTLE